MPRSLLRSFRVPGVNSFYLREFVEFVQQEYSQSELFTDIYLQAVSGHHIPAVDSIEVYSSIILEMAVQRVRFRSLSEHGGICS